MRRSSSVVIVERGSSIHNSCCIDTSNSTGSTGTGIARVPDLFGWLRVRVPLRRLGPAIVALRGWHRGQAHRLRLSVKQASANQGLRPRLARFRGERRVRRAKLRPWIVQRRRNLRALSARNGQGRHGGRSTAQLAGRGPSLPASETRIAFRACRGRSTRTSPRTPAGTALSSCS